MTEVAGILILAGLATRPTKTNRHSISYFCGGGANEPREL